MTRIAKQAERRAICPKKRRPSFAAKSGPKKDNLAVGYRVHENAVENKSVFIGKVK